MMLIDLLALALMSSPAGGLIPAQAVEAEAPAEPSKGKLVVHVGLVRGDMIAEYEEPVEVTVMVYPPQGVWSYAENEVKPWKAPYDAVAFEVPLICEVGVMAGSLTRGYVEQRLPAMIATGSDGDIPREASVQLVLPQPGPTSKVKLSTIFPPDGYGFDRASYQVSLPETGIVVKRGTLTKKDPKVHLVLPHGRYERRIEPYEFVSCGNTSPRPDWAQSSVAELNCAGGIAHDLTHAFERGSTFNVRFHAPPGMGHVHVTGTIRSLDLTQDHHFQLKSKPRPVVWGSRSDAYIFPYFATATDRIVFPREVFGAGEYVLTVSGPSLETLDVPITISLPHGARFSSLRQEPIEVQLVRKHL